MAVRRFTVPGPYDLERTLFPLRRGTGDPTMRIGRGEAWRATRTPDGSATLHVRADGDRIAARAWGPGSDHALEHAPDLLGATDEDGGFEPRDQVVARLWKRHRGIRLTRSGDVLQALIPAILEQKVTGLEARRAYRRIAFAVSEPAPGPGDLLLPPDPARLAALPYFAFHPFGVERRRADVIRRICDRASRIEEAVGLPLAEAKARLRAFPGVGEWTVAEVARLALGDPDAVSVGDFHLPHLVAWALAGEARGTDQRMLELLEPYRGHRGRVQRLLEAGGVRPPAFGPRMEARSIATL